jgi:DNA-binding transcriptional regulator YhcF (GntR family)
MEEKGFIILYRKLLDWEWYDHIPTKVLFIHLLLKANHTKKQWRGIDINRGQYLTSLNTLSQETGLSVKQVRCALNNLEKTGEVGKQTTKLNTLISVTNYDNYQSKGTPTDKVRANEGQSKGKARATTNNDNNDNNEEQDKAKQIYMSFNHLSITKGECAKLYKNWTKEQIDEILASIQNYKQNKKYNSLYLTAKNWLKREYGENGRQTKKPVMDELVKNVYKQIGYDIK